MTTTTRELAAAQWRVSSHSQQGGSTCVEVAALPGRVAIRDTTRRTAGHLAVPATTWSAFVRSVTR